MLKLNSILLGALLAVTVASCKLQAGQAMPETPCVDTLVGTWHLTDRECSCPPGPTPDETIILTASHEYSVYRNGQLSAQGTYAVTQGQVCGAGPMVPFLKFTPAAPGAYAPDGAYKLQNCTLVIDQCLAADGSVLTYKHPVD
jgi:hypothetical protein